MDGNDFWRTLEELVSINHIEKIKMNDLVIKNQIGKGGQATVYKGTYKNNEVAIKMMQNIDYKCFAHELVIIAYLEHPNIPKFYGIVTEQNIISLVFEFIDLLPFSILVYIDG